MIMCFMVGCDIFVFVDLVVVFFFFVGLLVWIMLVEVCVVDVVVV